MFVIYTKIKVDPSLDRLTKGISMWTNRNPLKGIFSVKLAWSGEEIYLEEERELFLLP